MFFPERQPAGLALCSGCFITFSWWCCEWILMPVVTHQQNAAGKYWARLQEGKTDVSEMRGQTLCYSVLLPVALYSTAWTVDLSCLSQTNSLPQFSSCLHDLYVSQCFLVEIEGSFRLGYGLFWRGGWVCGFFVPWHDKFLTGEYKWEIKTSAKPMEAEKVLCQHRKESSVLPLGMNFFGVEYISTITHVAWKDLSYPGFFFNWLCCKN